MSKTRSARDPNRSFTVRAARGRVSKFKRVLAKVLADQTVDLSRAQRH